MLAVHQQLFCDLAQHGHFFYAALLQMLQDAAKLRDVNITKVRALRFQARVRLGQKRNCADFIACSFRRAGKFDGQMARARQ